MKLYEKARYIAILVATMLVLSLVGGCSKGQTNTNSSTTSETKVSKEKFPKQPINLIVPFAAGGGTDQSARKLAELIQRDGVAVAVVNKPGGGGNIGFTEVAKAKPDGYTIGFATANLAINNAMGLSELSYKDFEAVIGVNTESGLISVRKDSKYKTIQDLINDAKANPGKLKIGVGSAGSPWLMGLYKLKDKANINFDIVTASTGGAEVASQLLGGHIDAACHAPSDFAGLLKSGDLRPLAVLGEKRSPHFPEVPTLKEAGYDVTQYGPRGIIAPKGTPQDVLDKIREIFKKALDSPEYREFLKAQLLEQFDLSGSEYAKFLKEEQDTYTELANKFNLKQQKK